MSSFYEILCEKINNHVDEIAGLDFAIDASIHH